MEIDYTLQAKNDLAYWKKINNIIILKKIRNLIEVITNTPYHGIGKPEQLKHTLSGCWSRRINQEHRIVYFIRGNLITILSIKGHY
ncbi:MAG: Txe/YoeB family addiction module toxin [Sphingobacteriales bacterium]|nr:MAG: Txe/YoeB family addiction module toxin [Sphingobacteriales bacterium]